MFYALLNIVYECNFECFIRTLFFYTNLNHKLKSSDFPQIYNVLQ